MAGSVQKQLVMLHPKQENGSKKPWDRLESELPKWYLRFTHYRLMGRQRSLQAVVEQERREDEALEENSINFGDP
jgi:hypothetical protein